MDCKSCGQVLGLGCETCESCFHYVNWTRLLNEPWPNVSVTELQVRASNSFNEFTKVHEITSAEKLFRYYKQYEALAAAASLAYKMVKIREQIPDPESIERRNNSGTEFADAIRKQKEDQRPKKEKQLLSLREREINKYLKLGLSQADAERFVDQAMSKNAKAVNPIK